MFFLRRWEDHVKHQEKLIILSRFIYSLAFLGYIFVNNAVEILLIQIVIGVATAIEIPAFDSLYSEALDKGRFASEWGAWESMYAMVTGISAITGGFIAQVFGFRVLFTVMFVSSLISLLISLLLARRGKCFPRHRVRLPWSLGPGSLKNKVCDD